MLFTRTSVVDQLSGYTVTQQTAEILIGSEYTLEFPGSEETLNNFRQFVRDEFGSQSASSEFQPAVCSDNEDLGVDVDEFAMLLRDSRERSLYNEHIPRILETMNPKRTGLTGQAHQLALINAILSDRWVGNRENNRIFDQPTLKQQAVDLLSAGVKLRFVFPGFPFKDQNPFRTKSLACDIDFAEISALIDLHILALAVAQVYPDSCEWIIASDGLAYASILGVSRSDVLKYSKQITAFIKKLNISNTVSVIDLLEVVERTMDLSQFWDLVSHIEDTLRVTLRTSNDEHLIAAFESLVVGMRRNINSKQILASFGAENSATGWEAVFNGGRSAGAVGSAIDKAARESALRYGAINVALRHCDSIRRAFPNALRATIHPKAGQVGLKRFGSVYPWNGVPFVRQWPATNDEIRIDPLYRFPGATPIRAHDGKPWLWLAR